MAEELRFKCTCCGEWHEGLPDLAFAAPYYYEQLSEEQKTTIAKKSEDLCTVADEDFSFAAFFFFQFSTRRSTSRWVRRCHSVEQTSSGTSSSLLILIQL